uniref:Protein vestigial n=2 Tax=Timema TaxID=61471 RepID=A0A7R8Z4Y5_TIMDO|nr:unnamed protein product [Timema douglasi]
MFQFNVQRSLEATQHQQSTSPLDPVTASAGPPYHGTTTTHHHTTSSHHSSAGSVSSGGGGVGSPGSPLRHKEDEPTPSTGRASGEGPVGPEDDEDDEDDTPGGSSSGRSRAQYMSANCVVFTHYSGDVAAVVDEHFTRALNYVENKGTSSSGHIKGYIALRNSEILTLPHHRYLDSFKMKLGPGTSGISKQQGSYLKKKKDLLESSELFVNILVDEVYVRPDVTYKGGKIEGMVIKGGGPQNDNIESRFGQYRQMSGGNYHISVTEILESEIKIKAISLLKIQSYKAGEFSIKDLSLEEDEERDDKELTESDVLADCPNVYDEVKNLETSQNELMTLIYIAGYAVHKIEKLKNCTSCLKRSENLSGRALELKFFVSIPWQYAKSATRSRLISGRFFVASQKTFLAFTLRDMSPMTARNFPPSFWNSNYQVSAATVTSAHHAAELYAASDPYHPHGATPTTSDPWHSHYQQYSAAAAHHHHRAVHEYHHHHNMAQYGGLLLPPPTRLPPHVTASHQYSKGAMSEPWGSAATHGARLHHDPAAAHHSHTHALDTAGYPAYPTMAGECQPHYYSTTCHHKLLQKTAQLSS